jgi:hypothetical protein
MSENTTIINQSNATIQHNVKTAVNDRAVAVGIALEIIKASAPGSSIGDLSAKIDCLSKYADIIQAALNKA